MNTTPGPIRGSIVALITPMLPDGSVDPGFNAGLGGSGSP